MEYKVKTRDGKEITIKLRDYLTYFERNELIDKAGAMKGGNVELKVGTLITETLRKVIMEVPDGIDWSRDIAPESLDAIFQIYAPDFGLMDKKKVKD